MKNSFPGQLSIYIFLIISFIWFTFSLDSFTRRASTNNFSDKTLGLSNIAQTTCTEPAGGCGDNWYWDANICACMQTSSSQCQEPTDGCGENHFWDGSSCTCVFSGDDTCDPPASGCPQNQYWDQHSCACVNETSCTPPLDGCPENHYWDSQSCICRMDSTCTEPAAGCGDGYYWSDSDCTCKQESTTTSGDCYPVAGECEIGMEWNYETCSCQAIPTICQPPATESCNTDSYWDYTNCKCVEITDYSQIFETYSTNSLGVNNFDRFAYEPVDRIRCIKSILTDSEYQTLRFEIGETEEKTRMIILLGKKVEGCWQGVKMWDGRISTTQKYLENEKCLTQSLGEKAYKEIYQGTRSPSYEEHLHFQKCYGKVEQSSLMYLDDKAKFPENVEKCLKSVLTEGVYKNIVAGSEIVSPESRSDINACFGIRKQPFKSISYKIPPKVESCLNEKLGKRESENIKKGVFVPSEQQRIDGLTCFDLINSTQQSFLPLPAEKVPFLREDGSVIGIIQVQQVPVVVKNRRVGGTVLLSGNASPDTVITIYIYSDPIVVTTKTDANGEWIYELSEPLEGQSHVAYAVTKSSSGDSVRSSVFNFTVEATDISDIEYFAKETEVAKNPWLRYVRYSLALIVFATTGVMLYQLYHMFFRNGKKDVGLPIKEEKLDTPVDGKGDGETGSGTVD